jgi:hypothetical protein
MRSNVVAAFATYVDSARFGRYLETAVQRWGNVSVFEPCERVRLGGMPARDPLNPTLPYNDCEQPYEARVCESITCVHDLRTMIASACILDMALKGVRLSQFEEITRPSSLPL